MKKVLILAMSSGSLIERRLGILDSYYKLLTDYPDIDLVFYSDDEDAYTIKVNANFSYNYSDNEIKTIAVFENIKNDYHNKYDWFFFVDDDTFVNIPLLNNIVYTFDEKYIYGRDIKGDYKIRPDLSYASGGAGFLISNKIIHKFFNMADYGTGYSDVNVGLNAERQGVAYKNDTMFHPAHPFEYYVDPSSADLLYNLTYHYIDPKMMKILTDLSIK